MFDFLKEKDKPEHTELITLIEKIGIPFGSRVWGGSTKKSDYDYLVTDGEQNKIIELCIISNIKYKGDGGGDYSSLPISLNYIVNIKLNSRKYQICSSDNYNQFNQCINIMSEYNKIKDMSIKKTRYTSFDNVMFFVKNKALTLFEDLNNLIKLKYPDLLV